MEEELERKESESYFSDCEEKPLKTIKVFDDCESLVDTVLKSCQINRHKICAQTRKIVRFEEEVIETHRGSEKKEIALFEDKVTDIYYHELEENIMAFARGLQHLNILKSTDRVGFFCDTRYEWMVACYGVLKNQYIVSTAYVTLGENNLIDIINEGSISTMFVSSESVKFLEDLKKTKRIPTLKTLIYVLSMKDQVESKKFKFEEKKILSECFDMISYNDLLDIGRMHYKKEFPKLTLGNVCYIVYTSGTTGSPKGIILRNRNMLSNVVSTARCTDLADSDFYLAYLPLAHILDNILENCIFCKGATVCYASVKTLVNAKPMGDVLAYRPTIFPNVPRVCETMRKKIIAKVNDKSFLLRNLFHFALKQKIDKIKSGRSHQRSIYDWLVFDKVKKQFGGRLRIFGSGGAKLQTRTNYFMAAVFGPEAKVGQGYGATECAGTITTQRCYLQNVPINSCGQPIDCIEMKLKDVPEMGYFVENNVGEIIVRGESVSSGYYKKKEKTKEVFKDGWYYTGDIGTILKDGSVRIIDRKSNMIKLQNGEFMAPEKLEGLYALSRFVAPSGIFIYADLFHDSCCAVVIIDDTNALSWANKKGIEFESFKDLLTKKELHDSVLRDFKRIAKNNTVSSFEYVKDVHLVDDEWTPQNKLLSNTMKLKRINLVKKYGDVVKEMIKNC